MPRSIPTVSLNSVATRLWNVPVTAAGRTAAAIAAHFRAQAGAVESTCLSQQGQHGISACCAVVACAGEANTIASPVAGSIATARTTTADKILRIVSIGDCLSEGEGFVDMGVHDK